MRLEFFIARRLASTADARRPGVMVRIATASVALGVAVMILSLAVITGFKREVTAKLTGFAGHVDVTGLHGLRGLETEPIRRSDTLECLIASTDGFVALAPYAVKGGIVKTPEAMQGIQLRGVDGSFDWSFFARHLCEGELPRVGDSVRTKDLLIARRVADRLDLPVGAKVEMLFIDTGAAEGGSLAGAAGAAPRRDRFRIAGIYDTGMAEMDGAVALTDLRNVQRLAGWAEDQVSGYTVQVEDFARAGHYAAALSNRLYYETPDDAEAVIASSADALYPNIFDWLKAHDVNAAVIIGIMLAVAFFNMAAALLILVMERTRMIGLLKTLGMTDGAVQRIFLWRAAFLVGRGLLWGNAAGIALCLVQKIFHPLRLDAEGYLLSAVPIALEWGWWIALNVGVAAAIVALLTLPAYLISSVKPDEAIRYR